MSDLLRCNRNIRVDAETTNDGTNYPNVAVRLEYSMCNWNQNPNYKILLDNDTARFSEWHAKTDTVIDRTKRTIYEKKWTNKVLESGECISIVQNTFIDTSLGNHNMDSLIQGNAVIDGEVIVPGNNGDEFCYAYAYENISFDKGELNAIPAPSPTMSPSTSPSKVPSKTKGSSKSPKSPSSIGVPPSPSTPKIPSAKHDPKLKGTDVASDVIAAAEGTDNSSTTPLKTVLSVVMMICGVAIVF